MTRLRIICAALVLALAASLPICAAAAGGTLFIESAVISENSIEAVVYSYERLSADDTTVLLGDAELEITSLEGFAKSDSLGTSYVILADMSQGLTQTNFNKLKAIAKQIVGGMGKNDDASIAFVGDELHAGDFSRSTFTLETQIDALEILPQKANLYAGMIDAAKLFSAYEDCRARKCLVVLSDGVDDHPSGATVEEVLSMLDREHISVASVALLKKYPEPADLQAAKSLCGIARRLPNGVDFTVEYAAEDYSDVAPAVLALCDNAYLLTADITGVAVSAAIETFYIKSGTASDGLELDTYALLALTASTPAPTSAPASTAAPVSDATAPDATSPLVSVYSGSTEPTPGVPSTGEPVNGSATGGPAAGEPVSGNSATLFGIVLPISPLALTTIFIAIIVVVSALIFVRQRKRLSRGASAGSASGGEYTLRLTRQGRTRFTYDTAITDSVIIGSSAVRSQLVLMDEESIAPTHCRISVSDGQFSLTALDAKAETALNNETVNFNQPVRLKQGDVIRLGELRLRVRWDAE